MHVEYADVKSCEILFLYILEKFSRCRQIVVEKISWTAADKQTNQEASIINLNPDYIRINIIY